MTNNKTQVGFTLIELSIVLVIIGLIIGGVLVGQDLIRAAAVRAQITQIEGYNTAANTFRSKYGYLPGDIKDPDASNFGFQARGSNRGQGDGNGIIEGTGNSWYSYVGNDQVTGGEEYAFWADLATARLIPGSYTYATAAGNFPSIPSNPNVLFPQAKIGQNNYVMALSGGNGYGGSNWNSDGQNYFGIVQAPSGYAGMTPQQAYSIDRKVDDGLPLTGNVLAVYFNWQINYSGYIPVAGNAGIGGTAGTSVPASSTTCFDNGGSSSAPLAYSQSPSSNNINCALTIRFQ